MHVVMLINGRLTYIVLGGGYMQEDMLTLVLRRGGGLLQPLRFFKTAFFCPINCAKHFYVIVFMSIMHL